MDAYVKCALCGWKYLPEAQALVPALDVITEGRTIALENVVLTDHAYCRRCVDRVCRDCPEAKFYSIGTTQRLIANLLERQAEREKSEAEAARWWAEKEAARKAEATRIQRTGCWTSRPLLPTVEIKAVDKNGYALKGAAAHNQVRKALKPVFTGQENEREQRRAARAARRALEREERELRRIRDSRRTAEILQAS